MENVGCYVTKEYDFHTALSVKLGKDVDIEDTVCIDDNHYILKTNKGNFCCESFGDSLKDTIHMKVYPVL